MRFFTLLFIVFLTTGPVYAADAPTNVTVFGDVPVLPNADPRPTPPQNYQIYVPREFKSDEPETTRTWSPSGYPGSSNQLTPFGLACSTDNDCQPPLVCLGRADSGQLPVKLCAFAPGK
jgi:hypothetical protein